MLNCLTGRPGVVNVTRNGRKTGLLDPSGSVGLDPTRAIKSIDGRLFSQFNCEQLAVRSGSADPDGVGISRSETLNSSLTKGYGGRTGHLRQTALKTIPRGQFLSMPQGSLSSHERFVMRRALTWGASCS
jgi:hypothetical protein